MTGHTIYVASTVHLDGTVLYTPRCTCGWYGINALSPDVAADVAADHADRIKKEDAK